MAQPTKILSEVISHIRNNTTVMKSSELATLSDLSTENIIQVRIAWEFLPAERKRSIAERLTELADSNTTLSFDNLFRFMLNDKDEQTKILAIRGLWENEQPSLLEPLVRLMEKDRSQEVRAEAAAALGKYALLVELGQLREAFAVRLTNALYKILEDPTENTLVKARALESIAPISCEKVTEVIKQAYVSGNKKLKIAAIYAMGKSAKLMWLPVIVTELTSEEPEERYEAITACGEMEDEGAVSYLRQCVHDDDLEVRLAIVEALRKIGGREAKILLNEMVVDDNESVSGAVKEAILEMDEYTLPKHKTDDSDIIEEEEEDDLDSFCAS
ncbi:MAG: HEAT repeat domain-containing protein [Chloroflexi bacterium]|nr:HEAT repeat domain-containing protein [Chloroflexota bacterium]